MGLDLAVKLDDRVVLECITARFLHESQVLVAAHHIRYALDELYAATFFVFEQVFLFNAGNVNRTRRQAKQAQVVLLDGLIGVCLWISRIQPL